jgi:putative FmdB family regulatory protein
MPIYEYECVHCKRMVEAIVLNIGDIPHCCEKCGGDLHKVISRSSFHLSPEGVGWARDGYSRSSQDGSQVVSITEPK